MRVRTRSGSGTPTARRGRRSPRSREPRGAAADGPAVMAHVLFVCLHNAGRSQMSRALFDRAAAGRHAADSAGTAPAARVHPEVTEVMREVGLEVGDRTPQKL